MKRLIFLIWLLMPVIALANNSNVVIGDTAYFNYRHSSAIDSAQLILMRGAVNDTLSLMPIVGTSHKLCELETIFNQVDSAGTYQVWIEPYSSAAIIDTILGVCQVELAARDVNVVSAGADAIGAGDFDTGAIDSDALADDIHFDSLSLRTLTIINTATTDPTVYIESDQGKGLHVYTDDSEGSPAVQFEEFGGGGYGFTVLGAGGDIYADLFGDVIGLDPTGINEIWEADSGTVDAGMGQMLKDTTAYQGEVGDISDVADTVNALLDTLQAGFGSRSAIGDSIQREALTALPDSVAGMVPILNLVKASVGDSLDIHVGRAGSATETVSLHMKVGSYTGGAGSNMEDDFDSLFADMAGTGFNVCSLWVYDTGNTVMVSDIMVQAENASGANQGRDRTNTTGISILNLNDGDYNLRIPMNSGYIQTTNPQPFTVSGATNDTIDVTLFTPTGPAGDLTTVYNWVKDGNDQPIKGVRVTASIPNGFWPVRYSNQVVVARHEASTDSTGLWELQIFGNDILLTDQGDSTSYWNITEYDGSEQLSHYKMTVSSDSTQQLGVPDDD